MGWSVDEAGLGLGEAPLSYGFGSTGKGVVNNQYNEYGEVYGVDDVITCMLVRAHHLFFMCADPVNIFASLSPAGSRVVSSQHLLRSQREPPRNGLHAGQGQRSNILPACDHQERGRHTELQRGEKPRSR